MSYPDSILNLAFTDPFPWHSRLTGRKTTSREDLWASWTWTSWTYPDRCQSCWAPRGQTIKIEINRACARMTYLNRGLDRFRHLIVEDVSARNVFLALPANVELFGETVLCDRKGIEVRSTYSAYQSHEVEHCCVRDKSRLSGRKNSLKGLQSDSDFPIRCHQTHSEMTLP